MKKYYLILVLITSLLTKYGFSQNELNAIRNDLKLLEHNTSVIVYKDLRDIPIETCKLINKALPKSKKKPLLEDYQIKEYRKNYDIRILNFPIRRAHPRSHAETIVAKSYLIVKYNSSGFARATCTMLFKKDESDNVEFIIFFIGNNSIKEIINRLDDKSFVKKGRKWMEESLNFW